MVAFNFTTMTAYTGHNAELVGNGSLPAFATFNQLKSAGFMVKKGAKSVSVFCGYRNSDRTDGKSVPVWGRVFDIVDTTAANDAQYMAWLAKEVEAGRVNTPLAV